MSTRHSFLRRTAAYALACCLVWADLAPLAQAASTDIANVPMATRSRAKPNLIMAVDDSGSMDGEFSPVRGFSTNDGAAWWNTTDQQLRGLRLCLRTERLRHRREPV